MALPCSATGSLSPAFAPARVVSLAVKPASAIALYCTVAKRAERTFESLRYVFGGDHPSQTTHHPLFSFPELGPRTGKGGISRATPQSLATLLRSLPPILHIPDPRPMGSYSKGARGLSVPLRVSGIFTATTISPSSRLRQRPDRYTIRAGRNLPDKEFRYLRTVIVTAAVYWGFGSKLRLAANFPP